MNDQELSEDYIRSNITNLDWYYVSIYHTLSENFIREFQDKVDWWVICYQQKLSRDFILKFIDKIILDEILDHQDLDQETRDYLVLLKG